jgi:hypothetical protein
MQTKTTQAGGFLLIVAMFAGTAWGISAGQPMLGLLIGTGAGIVIATAVWLVDRRRR